MSAAAQPAFSLVTERPGQPASGLQLQMMQARYGWAAQYSRGADVLEVACGAGMGLAMLSQAAASVTAGDLDPVNLAEARAAYAADPKVSLKQFDAMRLPFPGASFDTVLMFEALYYVPDAARFFAEAYRVLRPAGVLLIVSVNPEWSGFNPSPHSVHYHTARELRERLAAAGFEPALSAAFPETLSPRDAWIGRIRRLAVRLRLIPRTMSGKRFLKRLFYGRLEKIPARLETAAQPQDRRAIAEIQDLTRYRVLYAAAFKPSGV